MLWSKKEILSIQFLFETKTMMNNFDKKLQAERRASVSFQKNHFRFFPS